MTPGPGAGKIGPLDGRPHVREILVATGNPGKLSEIQTLIEPTGIRVVSPAGVGWDPRVPEDGDTLEANALAKARAGCAATGLATLADDSGLFVDALDGAPGVYSARYAGPAEDPAANCAKLLHALSGVPVEARGATFRCVIALVLPDGPEHLFHGACPGRIATAPRGAGGFGYDPLFEVVGTEATFAEMPGGQKHGFSHRGQALAALREFLVGTVGT